MPQVDVFDIAHLLVEEAVDHLQLLKLGTLLLRGHQVLPGIDAALPGTQRAIQGLRSSAYQREIPIGVQAAQQQTAQQRGKADTSHNGLGIQDIATAKPCSGQSKAAMLRVATAKNNGTLQSCIRLSARLHFLFISFYELLPLAGDFSTITALLGRPFQCGPRFDNSHKLLLVSLDPTLVIVEADVGRPRKSNSSNVLASEQLSPNQARAVIEERLRSAILDGRLPPGTAVRRQELATLFGVSAAPCASALRQLEAQSLLKVEMHKGAVVAPLIGEDAVDTYALRVLLESEALRQSIPLLDASDITSARGYIQQLENETRHAEIGRLTACST